jgi:NAD-dependent dihydropyrimidine dehydrogenase PreA subunit
MKTGADGAVYQRKDGIVIINPEKSKGERKIVTSCPYGAIYWNESLNVPQKCTLCAHLLDRGWKEPRCVEACPTLALRFGDLENPQSEISKAMASQKIEKFHPEFKTNPKVSYVGLPRLFIAGTVVFADTDECGANVQVCLTDSTGAEIGNQQTNGFGDFEFEGIREKGAYLLKVGADSYETKTQPIDLKEDAYLGEIFLKRSQVRQFK